MTLRITLAAHGPPVTTVKVEGRLTGDEAPELRGACEEIEGRLVLDLTDLKSADRKGVSVLRELRAKGAALIGVSPYLELLLDRQSHSPGN